MPIEAGAPAPDFVLRDQKNQDVRLSDFRGRRNVLLVFYPLAFTSTCQGELCSVRDNIGDFANDSTQVLAISIDSVASHRVWAEREGFQFPLLSDFWPHGAVAKEYGVFDEAHGLAHRGTFIVDKQGIIRYAEMYGIGHFRDQDAWRKALAELD